MQKEQEQEEMRHEEAFKNLVFANNLDLYKFMFLAPQGPLQGEVEGEVDDLIIPETVGDIANLLNDLKELGVDLSDTELD